MKGLYKIMLRRPNSFLEQLNILPPTLWFRLILLTRVIALPLNRSSGSGRKELAVGGVLFYSLLCTDVCQSNNEADLRPNPLHHLKTQFPGRHQGLRTSGSPPQPSVGNRNFRQWVQIKLLTRILGSTLSLRLSTTSKVINEKFGTVINSV